MKLTPFSLMVGTILLALVAFEVFPAKGQETADELRVLRSESNVLKATLAQRDKEIEALKKEIEALKAEPAQVELKELRKELAESRARTQELAKKQESPKPLEKKGLKITNQDLTPENVKKIDYSGAELLLDGFVLDTSAKDGEFHSVIAAGSTALNGRPCMVMIQGNVAYQIQVQVTGELAAKLRVADTQVRVRGTVRNIRVENGEMVQHSGAPNAPPSTEGLLIIVMLDNVSVP